MKTFTKIAAIGLTATLMATCFTACKINTPGKAIPSKKPGQEQAVDEKDGKRMVGGWSAAESTTVTEKHRQYFKDAINPINGYFYEPVALLGTQVVSGVNYVFLCKSTLDDKAGPKPMKLTYVYVNTSGEAKFMGDKNVTLTGTDGEQKPGGWAYTKDPTVTADIQKIVEKASQTRLGANYEAIAYLGSQVVAGTNHAILVKSTPVIKDSKGAGSFLIITVYENLDGKCEITDTKDVNLNFG